MASESKSTDWIPPQTIEEIYGANSGNAFSSINAPTAGPRFEKPLPSGDAPFQLYSLATPNGIKVSILLEELGIDYNAHMTNIMAGDQFGSGFVDVNPNSKIPCAVDKEGPNNEPVFLFESASIMLYLAEKYQQFFPSDPRLKVEVMNWIFWQMAGQGPMTGNFGHFFVYAPGDKHEARNYGVSRYGMEVQRLCSVLDRHLEGKTYMVGEMYTIADIAIFPWFNQLRTGYLHSCGIKAGDFLSVSQYQNANAWADRMLERPAVQRGLKICSWEGVKTNSDSTEKESQDENK